MVLPMPVSAPAAPVVMRGRDIACWHAKSEFRRAGLRRRLGVRGKERCLGRSACQYRVRAGHVNRDVRLGECSDSLRSSLLRLTHPGIQSCETGVFAGFTANGERLQCRLSKKAVIAEPRNLVGESMVRKRLSG